MSQLGQRIELVWITLIFILASRLHAAEPKYILYEFDKTKLSADFVAEGAAAGDLDGDGHADLVAGSYWYAGPKFETRHAFYNGKPFDPKGYSDNFFAFTHDIDGDGHLDILIIGFPGQAARWYRNPGDLAKNPDATWQEHIALDVVDNESPTFADVTGDGKPELVCMHDGCVGFASPGADATRPWPFVAVSPKGPYQKFTHGLGVGDIDGDGRIDILEKSGWWQQPANWDGKSPWGRHEYNFTGAGGSQMLVYDIDGDGDNDVVTSLNAHGYGLAWFEQKRQGEAITFERHDIMTDSLSFTQYGVAFSQLHAMALTDIDGDGLLDVVTGKRYWAHGGHDPGAADPAVLYWFQLKRENGHATFIPQPIDNDSGVGTQVTVADVNGDKAPDIVVANKKGVFVHVQNRRTVSQFDWFWANHPAMKSIGKTPEQTAAGMTLPKGFVSTLAIGEPDVHQPIAYTIDARGRLWVAENDSYPDWRPEGHDRIMIYEDTDGDGYFEKSTLFYDKLNFVSGIEVGFGGVFVGSTPNLLFIPDRDGDDKPDAEPQVLLDGWEHQDTHEMLNSFIWGPDGWLYGCQGVFTQSHVGAPGTPADQRQLVNAAIWRYHPIKKRFEVFAEGTSNPWGVDFDDDGQCFSTACVIPHAYHLTLGGRYQRQSGQHNNRFTYDDIKTIADHSHFAGGMRDFGTDAMDKAGGGHAHAGAMVYLGDNFPAEYRGKLFMNNIHGNRINMDVFKPKGSSYTLSHGPDFMLANDKWYRGLYLRYGPDGGVFASDWYDPRACHQQKPHDRTNGRIYKITYGKPAPVKVDLAKLGDAELVAMQLHQNDWYVRTARRLLMERAAAGKLGADAAPALVKIVRENKDETRRLRAMWALHDIGALDDALTLKCTEDESPFVRGWATQLALEDRAASPAMVKRMTEMAASDPSPIVRRYVASAMGRLPLDDRWAIAAGLMTHAEDDKDPDVPLMTWYGVEPLVGADPARAVAMIDDCKLVPVMWFTVRRAADDDAGLAVLVRKLAATEDGTLIRRMVMSMRQTLETKAHVTMPDGWEPVYAKLMAIEDNDLHDNLRLIAVRFGDPHVFPELRKVVMDGKAPMNQRQAALDILIKGDDKEATAAYQYAMDVPPLRAAALRGLAMTEDANTPNVILDRYAKLSDPEKTAAVAALTARPAYAKKLMEAVGKGVVPRQDVPVFAVRQMLKFDDAALNTLIGDKWGAIRDLSADKTQQMAKWKTLLNDTYMATADASNGRAIFTRTCAVCHTLYGTGGKIGPDLTGSNRADLDYLLENVLDPNATVGVDYQLSVLTLKDGRIVSGMIRQENDSTVTVQTVTEASVVDKAQIADRKTMAMSMMPEGLLATMQDADVRDLAAYLRSPRQIPLPGEGPTIDAATGRVAGAIEGESMKVVKVSGGQAKPQDMGGFAADRWSGSQHLWWINAKVGDALTLAIPVEKSGKYQVFAAMTKARDYGIVSLQIDGKPAGNAIDLFNAPRGDRSDVISTGPVDLGTYELSPGATLTVKMVGKNAEAEPRYMFALDYLFLKPVK
ncbi:MAG: c-type cytochrome [Planctomycetes bacterium]|nr:c-type cytochrome [Planctomycetota bacterium]